MICFVNNTNSLSLRENHLGLLGPMVSAVVDGTSHLLMEVPPWTVFQVQCPPDHSQDLWTTGLCSAAATAGPDSAGVGPQNTMLPPGKIVVSTFSVHHVVPRKTY